VIFTVLLLDKTISNTVGIYSLILALKKKVLWYFTGLFYKIGPLVMFPLTKAFLPYINGLNS
jgi:hypothetical protein